MGKRLYSGVQSSGEEGTAIEEEEEVLRTHACVPWQRKRGRRAASQRSLTVPPRSPLWDDRSHLRAKLSQFGSWYHLEHSNEARYRLRSRARDENRERRKLRYTASRQRCDCRRRRSPASAPTPHSTLHTRTRAIGTRACARSHLCEDGDVGEVLETLVSSSKDQILNLFPPSTFKRFAKMYFRNYVIYIILYNIFINLFHNLIIRSCI